jgi:hypothetical protein
MASAAAATEAGVTEIVIRNQLDLKPLENAKNDDEVVAAVDGLMKKMRERNHGCYYVELDGLGKIFFSNPAISHCIPSKEGVVPEKLAAMQELHQKLPSDLDIQPSAKWKYVEVAVIQPRGAAAQ